MSGPVFAARRVKPVAPGSAEWLRTVSASKIAAILGISPYESRFSLWHRMQGAIPQEADTAQLRTGHYLEPAVAAWFMDSHPEFKAQAGGSWVSKKNPAHTCSPDRMLRNQATGAWAPLEIKSARNDWEWGKEGTDEIPPYYRAQVAWQMYVLGLPVCFVAVITSNFTFREYVVHSSQVAGDTAFILDAVAEFEQSLRTNRAPSLDAHSATYQALRALHPDIDGSDALIPDRLADAYVQAKADLKSAEAAEKQAVISVMAEMGQAQRAVTTNNQVIATRQAKTGGKPYLVAARNLTPKTLKSIGEAA